MKRVFRLLSVVVICLPTLAYADPVKLKFAVFSPDTERLYNTVKKPFVDAVNQASGGTNSNRTLPERGAGTRSAATSPDGFGWCRRYRLYRPAIYTRTFSGHRSA